MKHNLIVDKLHAMKIDDKAREQLLCVAIAFALPLPSTQEKSITSHYTLTHKLRVDQLISEVNEEMLLDLNEALQLVRDVYVRRVNMAFWPITVMAKPMEFKFAVDFSDPLIYSAYIDVFDMVGQLFGHSLPAYSEKTKATQYL